MADAAETRKIYLGAGEKNHIHDYALIKVCIQEENLDTHVDYVLMQQSNSLILLHTEANKYIAPNCSIVI